MKTQFLFSYKYKKIGWWIFIPTMILGILCLTVPDTFPEFSLKDLYELIHPNVVNNSAIMTEHSSYWYDVFRHGNLISTILAVLIIVGGTFVGFSQNQEEDEFVKKIRFESLILAVYVNNIVLIICLIFVWGINFINVMVYNMFTTLIFFILCFYLRLYFNKKMLKNEK